MEIRLWKEEENRMENKIGEGRAEEQEGNRKKKDCKRKWSEEESKYRN